MPAQSRAQRRRANTRTQSMPPMAHTAPLHTPDLEAPIMTTETLQPEFVAEAAPAPVSASRSVRRLKNRAAPEPVDYTKDYKYAVGDLRLIALWSILLFAGMIALYFARMNGVF